MTMKIWFNLDTPKIWRIGSLAARRVVYAGEIYSSRSGRAVCICRVVVDCGAGSAVVGAYGNAVDAGNLGIAQLTSDNARSNCHIHYISGAVCVIYGFREPSVATACSAELAAQTDLGVLAAALAGPNICGRDWQ